MRTIIRSYTSFLADVGQASRMLPPGVSQKDVDLFKETRERANSVSLLCSLCFLQGCIQKFLDWPPGARSANGTAHCH
jgi:hypothetical protein